MKVDMLGFLLSQQEMFSHDVTSSGIYPAIDICHVTAAPPVPPFLTYQKIAEEAAWLRSQIGDRVERLIFGLQHPPLDATDENMHDLRYHSGISFSTIAYQGVNRYGGGFAELNAPFTNDGRSLLEMMARAGMILDLSHAGHRTARGALDYIEKVGLNLPVVATHTGCHSVYANKRNLPDDVLLSIRDRGGIVGIYNVTFGLDASDNSLAPFIAHIRHALHLLGTEAVAVGSDGIYQTLDLEKQQELFATMKAKIDPDGIFGSRFPADPVSLNTPTRMNVIADALRKEFPDDVVEKIVGGNAYRFLKKNHLEF